MSRKLDAKIAEALGYYMKTIGPEVMVVRHNSDGFLSSHPAPRYSTDGNAMQELDREMRERGWFLTVSHTSDKNTPFMATYMYVDTPEDGQTTVAKTEPLARALAAYKALTGKEWEGEGE